MPDFMCSAPPYAPAVTITADSDFDAARMYRTAHPAAAGLGVLVHEIQPRKGMSMEHIKSFKNYLIPALLMGIGAALGLAIPFAGFHLYRDAHGGEIALVVVLLAFIAALYFWGRNLRARIREDLSGSMATMTSLYLAALKQPAPGADERLRRHMGADLANPGFSFELPTAGEYQPPKDQYRAERDFEPMPLEKVADLPLDPKAT